MPVEPKQPHRRCWACGRYLKYDEYLDKYLEHATWDDYMGAWEQSCK